MDRSLALILEPPIPALAFTSCLEGTQMGGFFWRFLVLRNGRVEIIPNDQGNRITPSYVAFTDDERLIGEAAKNQVQHGATDFWDIEGIHCWKSSRIH